MKDNPYKLLLSYKKGLINYDSLTEKEKKDLRADIFALNLLVPKYLLKKECEKDFGNIEQAQYFNPYIDYLASKFQVDSVLIRCQLDSIVYEDQKLIRDLNNAKKVLKKEKNVIYVDFKKNSKF